MGWIQKKKKLNQNQNQNQKVTPASCHYDIHTTRNGRYEGEGEYDDINPNIENKTKSEEKKERTKEGKQ